MIVLSRSKNAASIIVIVGHTTDGTENLIGWFDGRTDPCPRGPVALAAEASGFLVGSAVFKTVEGATSSLAGSIPVRLRLSVPLLGGCVPIAKDLRFRPR